MSTRVYLASSEGESGKSAIALGLLRALLGAAGRGGVFRPLVPAPRPAPPVLPLLSSPPGIRSPPAAGGSPHHPPPRPGAP